MAGRRKRKASACLGSTQTGSPVRKSVRLVDHAGQALAESSQEDNAHGAASKFPWASLPTDLQEQIMSRLTVRDTARLTASIKSHDAHAIHRDMMHKRHEALRDILRRCFGEEAARLMPALDMADPGDVHVKGAQVPPLLQLHPHQQHYREASVPEVGYDEQKGRGYKILGRSQGYFRRAGLEGWGRWDCWYDSRDCRRSFVGEWRAGKRHRGRWTTFSGVVYTGGYQNDRQHGPTLAEFSSREAYDCVFDDGTLLSSHFRGLQKRLAPWARPQ